MNKKGVLIFFVFIMSHCRAEVPEPVALCNDGQKRAAHDNDREVVSEIEMDDFFGEYQDEETIKRSIPQHRSALSLFVMQSGLWVLMKLDSFHKRYVTFKKWLIRWIHGKRKA